MSDSLTEMVGLCSRNEKNRSYTTRSSEYRPLTNSRLIWFISYMTVIIGFTESNLEHFITLYTITVAFCSRHYYDELHQFQWNKDIRIFKGLISNTSFTRYVNFPYDPLFWPIVKKLFSLTAPILFVYDNVTTFYNYKLLIRERVTLKKCDEILRHIDCRT